jgi:hypothetical protein
MTDSATQITNLIGRYAECIDGGDFEGVADLLADADISSGDDTGDDTGHGAGRHDAGRHDAADGHPEDRTPDPPGDGSGGSATLTGRDRVLRLYETTTRRYEDGTPRTKHLTTNLIIEVDEEAGTATARSYWMVFQAVPGLPLQPILTGRYHDTFGRRGSAWRFTARRFLVDLVGDVSHHLLTQLPT